ncbi:MAG: YueI family protein [Bacillota bacterium]|nr:YueI family protein [Bacillota bacterium]
MGKQTVDEILQQGILGQKETKPEERRKFLGTLRERIIVALTQSQVRENGIYLEVEQEMKGNPGSHLLLNGHMSYNEVSKYVKIANKHQVKYTMVTNKEVNTDIGLVLAMDIAIDKEEIYLKKKQGKSIPKVNTPKSKFSLFRKLFKK